MRAEVVVLGDASPVGVDHGRALLAGADAVHPVVLVGEAAAGPAEDRNLDPLQRLHHVVADAARVGDRAVLAHPDAAVDAAAQVLGELAVDVAVDRCLGFAGMNNKLV